MGRASRYFLVAGTLVVAKTCWNVEQPASSYRVLGSNSDQACVGSAQSVWQWRQQQGGCVLRGMRATMGRCLVALLSFLMTSEVTGAIGGACSQTSSGGR